MRSNRQFGAALAQWFVAMMRCYHEQLSAAEVAALHQWEASADFTSTDLWPGWARHIGLRPGQPAAAPHRPGIAASQAAASFLREGGRLA